MRIVWYIYFHFLQVVIKSAKREWEIKSNSLNKYELYVISKYWRETSLVKIFCFFKQLLKVLFFKKLPENKPFYVKMRKWREKVNFMMSFFLNCGHLNPKWKLWKKNFECISVQIKHKITINCRWSFKGAILGSSHIYIEYFEGINIWFQNHIRHEKRWGERNNKVKRL